MLRTCGDTERCVSPCPSATATRGPERPPLHRTSRGATGPARSLPAPSPNAKRQALISSAASSAQREGKKRNPFSINTFQVHSSNQAEAAVKNSSGSVGLVPRVPAAGGQSGAGMGVMCGTDGHGAPGYGAPNLCGTWLGWAWNPACTGQGHTGHRGPVMRETWSHWAEGTHRAWGHVPGHTPPSTKPLFLPCSAPAHPVPSCCPGPSHYPGT